MSIVARAFATLVSLSLVALLGAEASAYVWYTAKDSGEPMRWFRTELTVRVSTVAPGEIDWQTMYDITEASYAAWDIPGCKIPQVDVVGTTEAKTITSPTSFADEPDNIVVFIPTTTAWRQLPGSTGTQIALTFIAHNTQTGEIIDADIAVNDGGFKFTTEDDATSGIDLLSAITHEVGHFFGMDHSLDNTATMYASYGDNIAARTNARTLEEDDMDGVCALYEDVPAWVDPNAKPPADDGSCNGSGATPSVFFAFAFAGLLFMRRRQAVRG